MTSRTSRRLAYALMLLVVAILAVAQPASAARRRLPFGAMALDITPNITLPGRVSDAQLDRQFALMARSGVESARTDLPWSYIQPARKLFRWDLSDRLVRDSARHGIQLIPIINFTPAWASTSPTTSGSVNYAPRLGPFDAFLKALVGRYGPRGTFWKQNPRVPRRPQRYWQMYNEPQLGSHWAGNGAWPRSFSAVMRSAHATIHKADRGAKVIAPAFAGKPLGGNRFEEPWTELGMLYKGAGRKSFDIAALNEYTFGNRAPVKTSLDHYFRAVKYFRAVMRRHHDGRKPLWLTEMGWPTPGFKVPRSRQAGTETTRKGRAQRLTGFYNRLAKQWRTGFARAYWYDWNTSYQGRGRDYISYQYYGLTAWTGPGSLFRPQPVLTTYRNVAAKLEGCRKTGVATRCAKKR
jgi:polysaccharide biosynthesis protein PslG